MPATFTCIHCGQIAPRNVRLQKDKLQKYCSLRACQNARRQEWRKRRYEEDSEYRDRCLGQQKSWRHNHSADQYQKNYRETHPDYVVRNRELQGHRNAKRKVAHHTSPPPEQIVIHQPGDDGHWLLCEFVGTKIVNRYALSLYPNVHGDSTEMGSEGTEIVNRYALLGRTP